MTQPPGSPTAPTNARMRLGVVQASPAPQADYVWVMVDGAPIQAAYFTNYVPITNDRVTVTQDGTDWFVLGGKSGASGNLVVNGDFMVHPQPQLTTSLPPYMWGHYRAAGSAASVVSAGLSSVYQKPVMFIAVNSASASDNYAYSAAFPVTPGDLLYVDASGSSSSSGGVTLTTTLRVGWFIDGQSVYPNFISETVVQTNSTTTSSSWWLTGTATAPAGAAYARVAIRANQNAGASSMLVTAGQVEAHR